MKLSTHTKPLMFLLLFKLLLLLLLFVSFCATVRVSVTVLSISVIDASVVCLSSLFELALTELAVRLATVVDAMLPTLIDVSGDDAGAEPILWLLRFLQFFVNIDAFDTMCVSVVFVWPFLLLIATCL